MPVLPAQVLLLDAKACRAFAPILREGLRRAVRDGFRIGNSLWEELDAMERVAAGVADERCRDNGAGDKVAEDGGTGWVVQVVGVAEAADLLGCSRSAVTARIRRKTLPAERDERGRYLIRVENLEVA